MSTLQTSKYLVTSSNNSPPAGSDVTLTAQLADANDNSIAIAGLTVTWSKSNGNGTFATATSQTDASGIATVVFSTHTVAGTATTVTATDNNGLTGTSYPISTKSGSASKYLVTSSNNTPGAGSQVTITAQLADANNNRVATSGLRITWTQRDDNGTFSSFTSQTDASGIASIFLTTHKVAGTTTSVTATDEIGLTGTSALIATGSGPATKYLIVSTNNTPEAGSNVIISAQLVDANNNPVATSGLTVTWAKSNANGTFASSTSQTNASGLATIVFTTHTAAGTISTVTATDNNGLTGKSGTITTNSGTPTKYLVTASNNRPDAGSDVTVLAQLVDTYNNPVAVPGVTVFWSKPNGVLADTTSETDSRGIATISFTTHTVAGTVSAVTATDENTLTGTSAAIITGSGKATKYLVTSSNNNPSAGSNVTITAQLADAYNNPVASPGLTVTWIMSNGTFAAATSQTNANGIATILFTTHTVAGTATTITATDDTSLTGTSATIITTSGTATKYLVTSSNNTPSAGNDVTITAQLADAYNNPVPTAGVTVTWAKTNANGTFASATSHTNAQGIATVVFTPHTVAGTTSIVTATDNNSLTGSSNTITTICGAASNYLVTSSNKHPIAGSPVTIHAQLVDVNNNPVASAGLIVTWSKSNPNGTFAAATSQTIENGVATVVFSTHTVPGTSSIITATDNNSLTGNSGAIVTDSGPSPEQNDPNPGSEVISKARAEAPQPVSTTVPESSLEDSDQESRSRSDLTDYSSKAKLVSDRTRDYVAMPAMANGSVSPTVSNFAGETAPHSDSDRIVHYLYDPETTNEERDIKDEDEVSGEYKQETTGTSLPVDNVAEDRTDVNEDASNNVDLSLTAFNVNHSTTEANSFDKDPESGTEDVTLLTNGTIQDETHPFDIENGENPTSETYVNEENSDIISLENEEDWNDNNLDRDENIVGEADLDQLDNQPSDVPEELLEAQPDDENELADETTEPNLEDSYQAADGIYVEDSEEDAELNVFDEPVSDSADSYQTDDDNLKDHSESNYLSEDDVDDQLNLNESESVSAVSEDTFEEPVLHSDVAAQEFGPITETNRPVDELAAVQPVAAQWNPGDSAASQGRQNHPNPAGSHPPQDVNAGTLWTPSPARSASKSASHQFTDLGSVLKKYLFHWPLFLLGLLITLSLAFAYLKIENPVYEVGATILVKDEKKTSTEDKSALKEINETSSPKTAETEIQIIQSKKIVNTVVNDLRLWSTYKVKEGFKTLDLYATPPFRFVAADKRGILKEETFDVLIKSKNTFEIKNLSGTPGVNSFNKIINNRLGRWMLKPTDFLDQYIGSTITVTINNPEKVSNSYVKSLDAHLLDKAAPTIGLSINDEVPKRGKDFLNYLIKTYNEASIDEEKRTTKSTIEFIDKRLASLTGELNSAERQVEGYRSSQGLTDINSQSQVYLENVQTNDNKLNELNVQLNVVEGIENYVNSPGSQSAPATIGVSDPSLNSLVQKLSDLQLQKSALLATTPESNPIFGPINDQITTTKSALKQNVRGIKSSLVNSKRQLNAFNNKFESSIRDIPVQERQYVGMKRQESIKENLYVYLLQKREELSLSYASTLVDARIVDQANVGDIKWPRPALVLAIALLLGLGIPFLIIYFRSTLKNKITERRDIETAVDVPILGELSYEDQGKEIIVLDNTHHIVGEQFRSLRTNLHYLHDNRKGNGRVTLFTSSVSGEGKSFVSSNLAASLASTGRKTVILEMDLRKPKISTIFNLPQEHSGISDYLASDLNTSEIIQPSGIEPNLDIIGSGHIPPNPSELLEKQRLNQLIDELKLRYDDVIIDSPPLHLVTDAMIIARLADVSLYIIKQGHTGKDELTFIRGVDESGRLPRLNLIFNGIKKGKYGYGYNYDNSYYTQAGKPSFNASLKLFASRF